jgi:hypothetical protein
LKASRSKCLLAFAIDYMLQHYRPTRLGAARWRSGARVPR